MFVFIAFQKSGIKINCIAIPGKAVTIVDVTNILMPNGIVVKLKKMLATMPYIIRPVIKAIINEI